MKFSKKDFKTKYKPKSKEKEVDESLYGLEPGKKHYTHDEIYTDTQEIPGDDTSDFETDIPIDTDKKKVNTMNVGADMARGGNMGVRYGVNTNEEVTEEVSEGMDEAAKEKMKSMVQELLKQRTKENEFVSNDQYGDVDSNNQPDLSQLKDITLINKTNAFLNVLTNAKPEQIEIVINHLNTNINKNTNIKKNV